MAPFRPNGHPPPQPSVAPPQVSHAPPQVPYAAPPAQASYAPPHASYAPVQASYAPPHAQASYAPPPPPQAPHAPMSLSPAAFQSARLNASLAPSPLPPPVVLQQQQHAAMLMAGLGSPKNDGRAIGSLVLGILSMTCLGFLAGIPAIIMGAMSRKEIDRSQGALTGRGIAAGGIVTGLFGTGISLVVGALLLGSAVDALGGSAAAEPRTAEAPTRAPVGVPLAAGTRSYGTLEVVDLDSALSLKAQLDEIARTAATKKRTVMLQTYVRSSKECAEVAAALPDTRMQRALKDVTLVRVDIDAFEDALRGMRVETDSAPWFYKLDANARPTDAISADEWDANVPENMAPVLSDFARGVQAPRRSPSPVGTAL